MQSLIDKNQEALEILSKAGRSDDQDIDLARTAIALGALGFEQSGLDLSPYFNHIEEMEAAIAQKKADSCEAKIKALNEVLFDQFGYEGNQENYDSLDNANLIQVINKRKGLPVAIGLLYIHLGQFRGWEVAGLNFPGHFIARIGHDGLREIIDPFQQGKILQANDLRDILKQVLGPQAELSATFYEPVSRRHILLRLQNNLKMRLVRDEHYAKALEQIEIMQILAPEEEKLLFDAGILHSKIGNLSVAIDLLEQYRDRADSPADKQEAGAIIQGLMNMLH